MVGRKLTLDEIVELDQYSLWAYLGLNSNHSGSTNATRIMLSLADIKNGTNVDLLDIGCGAGHTPCFIAKEFKYKVTGIDYSSVMIDTAVRYAKRKRAKNIKFQLGDAYNLPFEDNKFDIVIMESVLLTLDRDKALEEVIRVLKPGGYFLDLETYVKDDAPAETVQNLKNYFLANNEHTCYTLSEWKSMFAKHNFIEPKYIEKGLMPISISDLVNYMAVQLKLKYYCFRSKRLKEKMRQLDNSIGDPKEFTYIASLFFCGRKEGTVG